jgi:hypothetical protein
MLTSGHQSLRRLLAAASTLESRLRKSRLAALVGKPYRALFCRYADHGYTSAHPYHFSIWIRG